MTTHVVKCQGHVPLCSFHLQVFGKSSNSRRNRSRKFDPRICSLAALFSHNQQLNLIQISSDNPHGVCELKINCSSFSIKCAPAKRSYISCVVYVSIYRV